MLGRTARANRCAIGLLGGQWLRPLHTLARRWATRQLQSITCCLRPSRLTFSDVLEEMNNDPSEDTSGAKSQDGRGSSRCRILSFFATTRIGQLISQTSRHLHGRRLVWPRPKRSQGASNFIPNSGARPTQPSRLIPLWALTFTDLQSVVDQAATPFRRACHGSSDFNLLRPRLSWAAAAFHRQS